MRSIGLLSLLLTIGFSLTSCASYHSRDTDFTAQQRAAMSQPVYPSKHDGHLT